jgi:hypothetical protein
MPTALANTAGVNLEYEGSAHVIGQELPTLDTAKGVL